MCQIIHKPKDFTLPFDLLESTCLTNSDGFGMMMFDRGKIVAEKIHEGDNDPEALMKVLETLHSEELFMHFRYRTRGGLGTENCHPFRVYNDNDREVYLMHNGTISGYGSDKQVDSEAFGLELVAPMYDRSLKAGVRNPLKDPFFNDIVTKIAGKTNRVVLLDNTGDHTIINEDTGYLFTPTDSETEFWVANTYSFNRSHRTPTPTTYTHYRSSSWNPDKGGSTNSNTPFLDVTDASTTAKSGALLPVPSTTIKSKEKKVGFVPKQTERTTYSQDVLNLDGVDDLLDMTFEDISDLVDIEPENAKLLIAELFYELYTLSDRAWADDEEEDEEENIVDAEVVVN